MVAVLFALSSLVQSPPADAVAELCKPALAQKAGEIAAIDVGSSRVVHGRRIIEGRLTAYARMAQAPAGFARTQHIGRLEFNYRCEVRNGQVRKTRVSPFKP